ncbi:rhodanese-like domain-containing protein [Odoribacter sp. OttesenSCG-928-L07]|nr:rhodanese-like domain-containing protein [Odoribacter sp. OttesenSCG-928-L07]MDL2238939.1 rhodanese-like domain-containing protein [Bacteroidales bacterium OttesenSCG-928-L14]
MIEFFNRLFGLEDKPDSNELLKSGATLIDVRTKEEYKQGAAKRSINIPLDTLNINLSKIKKEKPIIVVCASGIRSRSAVSLLKSKGFSEVHNGGIWSNYK